MKYKDNPVILFKPQKSSNKKFKWNIREQTLNPNNRDILKVVSPQQPSINFQSVFLIPKRQISQEKTTDSPSICEFTYDTKSVEEFHKGRLHLFSAQNKFSQNSSLIPSIEKRPLSNLNANGNLLWKSIQIDCVPKEIKEYQSKNNMHNKKGIKYFEKEGINNNDNIRNIRKIKIERGMMSKKLVDNIVKKFNCDFNTQNII